MLEGSPDVFQNEGIISKVVQCSLNIVQKEGRVCKGAAGFIECRSKGKHDIQKCYRVNWISSLKR